MVIDCPGNPQTATLMPPATAGTLGIANASAPISEGQTRLTAPRLPLAVP